MIMLLPHKNGEYVNKMENVGIGFPTFFSGGENSLKKNLINVMMLRVFRGKSAYSIWNNFCVPVDKIKVFSQALVTSTNETIFSPSSYYMGMNYSGENWQKSMRR